MAQNEDRREDRLDGAQKTITFATRTSLSMPETSTEDETPQEADEPPENNNKCRVNTHFHRSTIRPNNDRKESLLTKALMSSPDTDTFRPEIHLVTDIGRRRSYTSTISSLELTSDGGLTSPSTPSPPVLSTTAQHMASLNLGPKTDLQNLRPLIRHNNQELEVMQPAALNVLPEPEPTVEILTKKRCITFACGGQRPASQLPSKTTTAVPTENTTAPSRLNDSAAPQKRACAIKFACPATVGRGIQVAQPVKPAEAPRRPNNKSPTLVRKSRPASSPRPSHRTSPSLARRTSQSPLATRRKRPAFLTSNKSVQSSEATRFHEFASEVVEEDDWIRRDSSDNKKKLTISDTLKKENAIRQLGKEAEEEALQEEEDDEQDEDDDNQDSDGEEREETSDGGWDADETDGNETDNEAGFAESDEETDDEFQFWVPGKPVIFNAAGEASTYRASAHRTTSESSIDSPRYMSPPALWSGPNASRSKPKVARQPKIRPGTPDLPDSTDFVCGTLDEDRPLEEAYLSCMEVRKRERHRAIPQDIDPSFPTSDPENDGEDEDMVRNDSDEPVWIHGKFEESDEHDHTSRHPRTRKSPLHSPKRMQSPPPPKSRMRSPAPRRLFGGTSPKHMRLPAPMRHTESPRASPASHAMANAITFTPLGQRPGLTHTKSLPRTPNAFCKQYRAVRLAAANADLEEEETTDGHTRGAIDIVKGLEQKKQHRKEKLSRKHHNRIRKGGPERKPQPGQGAERMRTLALHMAGKGVRAQYVLSI